MAGVTEEFPVPSSLTSVRSDSGSESVQCSGFNSTTRRVELHVLNPAQERKHEHEHESENPEARTRKGERRYYPSVFCLALDTTTPGGSCAIASDALIVREAAVFLGVAAAQCHIGFAADDGFDAVFFRFPVKLDGAEHIAVIRHRYGRLSEGFHSLYERFNLVGAVEKTELGVQMQVHEGSTHDGGF